MQNVKTQLESSWFERAIRGPVNANGTFLTAFYNSRLNIDLTLKYIFTKSFLTNTKLQQYWSDISRESWALQKHRLTALVHKLALRTPGARKLCNYALLWN